MDNFFKSSSLINSPDSKSSNGSGVVVVVAAVDSVDSLTVSRFNFCVVATVVVEMVERFSKSGDESF